MCADGDPLPAAPNAPGVADAAIVCCREDEAAARSRSDSVSALADAFPDALATDVFFAEPGGNTGGLPEATGPPDLWVLDD